MIKPGGRAAVVPAVVDAPARAAQPIEPTRTPELDAMTTARFVDPPNARLSLAFDVRRLQALPGGTAELRRWLAEGPAINDALLRLIDRLFPDALRPPVDEVAARILALDAGAVRAAFAGVSKAGPFRALVASGPGEAASATVALGRQIAVRCAKGSEALARLDVVACPAALGRLAVALGVRSAGAFERAVSLADADALEEMRGFLEVDFGVRRSLQQMAQATPSAARPVVTPSDALERGLADPTAVAFAERSSALMVLFGVPRAEADATVQQDIREGLAELARAIERLRDDVGDDVCAQALARVDPVRALFPDDHVAMGGTISARQVPWPVAGRVERVKGLLADEALRVMAEAWLAQLPNGAELSSSDPAVSGLLAVAIVEQLASGGAEEHSRLLGRHDGRAQLSARLAEALHEDASFLAELGEFREALLDVARTEQVARAGVERARAELDGGLLRLPKSVLAEMRAHFSACHPAEGIGYVLTDGDATVFFPIENRAHDRRAHGVQDGGDLARMNAMLEHTGLFVLGMAHSHPDARPFFSQRDLDEVRDRVALSPGRRTIIVGVERSPRGLSCDIASFASDPQGQVIAEDRVHAR